MSKFNDKQLVNYLRCLSIDMIDNAGSGHPGIALSMAPIIYTLYKNHMKFNPDIPSWCNRDRLILSAGHASALLYATLFLNNYNYKLEDLKSFRHLGSICTGHPEYNLDYGIEMTTGPLAEGIGTAVGMAISEKYLENTFNTKESNIFDYKIYVLCGDGDLMEGLSYESASLAGTLKLDNLIVLYDSNGVSLDGNTSMTFDESVLERFEVLGWDVIPEVNGDKVGAIDSAIAKAKKNKKPTIIEFKTTLGAYSPLEGTNKVHGTPLSKMDIKKLKTALEIDDIEPFHYDEEVLKEYRKYINDKSYKEYDKWKKVYDEYIETSNKKDILESIIQNKEILIKLEKVIDFNKIDIDVDMRKLNEIIMSRISDYIPSFIGGNADVSSSTKILLNKKGIFNKDNYSGRNIYYGVREHLMASCTNGIALSNLRPFSGTYLAFSDYMKPSIRLSAMMNIPSVNIFTHDSIIIGPDGPTHQPIEQLPMLRAIPNYSVYRPCDVTELIGSWNLILKDIRPCALVLPRAKTINLKTTSIDRVKHGAYILSECKERLDIIIMASGQEVDTALEVKQILKQYGLDIRVISVPNLNRFCNEDEAYINKLLPKRVRIFVIEYSNETIYNKFTHNRFIFNINTFGTSGTTEEVIKHYKLDASSISNKIIEILKG